MPAAYLYLWVWPPYEKQKGKKLVWHRRESSASWSRISTLSPIIAPTSEFIKFDFSLWNLLRHCYFKLSCFTFTVVHCANCCPLFYLYWILKILNLGVPQSSTFICKSAPKLVSTPCTEVFSECAPAAAFFSHGFGVLCTLNDSRSLDTWQFQSVPWFKHNEQINTFGGVWATACGAWGATSSSVSGAIPSDVHATLLCQESNPWAREIVR